MNRLTAWICGYPHGKAGVTLEKAFKETTYSRGKFEATAIVERLCAYEDTGLTPEEITALIADNKRLHELVDIIERTIKAL